MDEAARTDITRTLTRDWFYRRALHTGGWRVSAVGNRSIILKFSYVHQDASMEYTSNEGKGVHIHTLVDRERKRSNERG